MCTGRENGLIYVKGPHVKNLKQIGAIKVLHQSGAYWRGDEKKAQLQRIYGTAFHSEKDLRQHLRNLGRSLPKEIIENWARK